MIIKGKRYKFNIKKLLSNIGGLITFILLELLTAYIFVEMVGALIERYS
jgi:hypothetical protein